MKIDKEDKVFFLPGDIVVLRQDIDNKPSSMLVIEKSTKNFHINGSTGADSFKGMLCRWFTTTGEMQEAIFNTKDLKLVRDANLLSTY